MRPGRFRASCDEILMAEIGPNASGGTENPLGKTETGTHKVTSRPTAPNQSVMATPTCQRRRNLHGFRKFHSSTPFLDHIILRCAKFAPCDAQGNYDTIRFGKGESLRHRQAGKFPALGEEKSSPLFFQCFEHEQTNERDQRLHRRIGQL